MKPELKTVLLILIGVAGYAAWGVYAYFEPSTRASFLALNQSMVAGTIGLVLRDMQSPSNNKELPQ
jgi:hypothetical protein